MNNFNSFYKNTKTYIEKKMNLYNDNLLKNNIPEVEDALKMFVDLNKDGKYLRGVLVALGYKIMGVDDDEYIPLALAIELFQTSILIHDDIIDNASKRRGKYTIPMRYKIKYNDNVDEKYLEKRDNYANSMAIVIADIGLYEATNLMIKNYSSNTNLLKYYHDITLNTMKGELIDVELPFLEEYYNSNEKLMDKVFSIYKLKTSYYSVVGPFILGMILGGATNDKIKVMTDILMNVGIAYQIKDDILGIYGEESVTGKTNSDIEEYKQTILYAYTLDTEYKNDLKKYYGKSGVINKIQDIFEISGAKKYSEDKSRTLLDDAINKIECVDFLNNEDKNLIKEFIGYLNAREK